MFPGSAPSPGAVIATRRQLVRAELRDRGRPAPSAGRTRKRGLLHGQPHVPPSPSYAAARGPRSGRHRHGGGTASLPRRRGVRARHLRGRDPDRHAHLDQCDAAAAAGHREIVGVVGHVKERPDEIEPQPQVYVPLAQNVWVSATMVVQPVTGPAEALAPAVRSALARVDGDRSAVRFRTLKVIGDEATARPRFRAFPIGTFAVLALVLAMVGVFGVLAYSVQQRTREFGVRIALGATTRSVLALVVASATPIVAIGALGGLGAAAALSRTIASFLFGVRPTDPMTFAFVGLVIAMTAAAAMAAPALRATRVDPVEAFRAGRDEALASIMAMARVDPPGGGRRDRLPHRDAHASSSSAASIRRGRERSCWRVLEMCDG